MLKEDLKLPNHLMGHRRLFLQLSFHNISDLLTVRRDLMPLALENGAKRDAVDAYAEVIRATAEADMEIDFEADSDYTFGGTTSKRYNHGSSAANRTCLSGNSRDDDQLVRTLKRNEGAAIPYITLRIESNEGPYFGVEARWEIVVDLIGADSDVSGDVDDDDEGESGSGLFSSDSVVDSGVDLISARSDERMSLFKVRYLIFKKL